MKRGFILLLAGLLILGFLTGCAAQTREAADRVMFLDEGVIIEEGPPGQIYNNPRVQRTKDFLRQIL